MIALKIIHHTSFFNPTNNPLISILDTRKKHCSLTLCRSKSDDSGEEGDRRRQELLARIVMLQAKKVRLTDYLDERSAYLSQFAEEANAEIDAIGENALKDLDEASSRIMENIESRMQAFEESAEENRQEIANRDGELAAFEGEIERGRNEGLFFKSLGERAPVDKAKAKEETEKIKEVTNDSARAETRRNIYLGLTGIVAVGIANSFVSSSPDWRKVALLGAIFVGLLSQVLYEQRLLSETGKQGIGKNDEDKM